MRVGSLEAPIKDGEFDTSTLVELQPADAADPLEAAGAAADDGAMRGETAALSNKVCFTP